MEPIQEESSDDLQGLESNSNLSLTTALDELTRASCHQAERVSLFLRRANLSPPSRVPVLTRPVGSPVFSSPQNIEKARVIVLQQTDHKAPEKQLRSKWLPQSRQHSSSHDAEQFRKHHVAQAFNKLLFQRPVEPFDVAQAILSLAPGISLYELWRHFHDPKLEDRMASRLKKMTGRLG